MERGARSTERRAWAAVAAPPPRQREGEVSALQPQREGEAAASPRQREGEAAARGA